MDLVVNIVEKLISDELSRIRSQIIIIIITWSLINLVDDVMRTRTSWSTWLSWLPDKSFPWRGPGTRPSWSTWLAMLPDKSWPCRGTKKDLHDYLNNTTFTIITWSILPLTRSWDRAFMINSSTCSTGKVVSLNKRRSVNLARSANNNIYHSKNARSKDLLMRPYHKCDGQKDLQKHGVREDVG